MKGKLNKHENDYALILKQRYVALTNGKDFKSSVKLGELSLKNCQEIERGYDLDRLAEEFAKNHSLYPTAQDDTEYGFKHGFQKALELMSDKKFSEEDMINFGGFCVNNIDAFNDVDDLFKKYQPLQQSEWDVEVEIDEEKEFILDPAMGITQGHYLDKPKLDADGCLILKLVK